VNVEEVNFYNNKFQKLAAKIYSHTEMSANGVIYCHGMFSGKDGYKITRLAESIVNAGFTLFTFDFSFAERFGDKISAGDNSSTGDKISGGIISELSILQEVDDLNSAYHFFRKCGMNRINLIGSSMGGLVSLLFSSVSGDAISSQTLIATPILLNELLMNMANTSDAGALPENGFTEVDGRQIHNKFFKEAMEINIEKAIVNSAVPTLIIHGAKDTVVSLNNAVALAKFLHSEKRMVLIEGGDHNLTRDSDLKILRENILEWLKLYCS
jgi:esterase/lipase